MFKHKQDYLDNCFFCSFGKYFVFKLLCLENKSQNTKLFWETNINSKKRHEKETFLNFLGFKQWIHFPKKMNCLNFLSPKKFKSFLETARKNRLFELLGPQKIQKSSVLFGKKCKNQKMNIENVKKTKVQKNMNMLNFLNFSKFLNSSKFLNFFACNIKYLLKTKSSKSYFFDFSGFSQKKWTFWTFWAQKRSKNNGVKHDFFDAQKVQKVQCWNFLQKINSKQNEKQQKDSRLVVPAIAWKFVFLYIFGVAFWTKVPVMAWGCQTLIYLWV